MSPGSYGVLLFESVSAALAAEKVLKDRGIPNKLIPVPKHISSDCGVCLRLVADDLDRAGESLAGRVKVVAVRGLP
jgi:hypothetical protein